MAVHAGVGEKEIGEKRKPKLSDAKERHTLRSTRM